MRIKCCARVFILCLTASCTVPARVPVQRQQYYVNDKPVSEEVYRAARFYNEALPLIEANRLAEARVKLIAAIRLAPDYYDAHYNLGVVLLKLEREQDASEHFRTIVAAKANLPSAWVSLGTIYVNAGKHGEAVTTFTDAMSRFPTTTWQQIPELYVNFGMALGKIGRTDEAIENFKLALRANSELPLVWMNLGIFYQASGQIRQSIEHYKEFIKRSPANNADVSMAVDTNKILEAELREASTIKARSDEEYYVEVTKYRPNTWPRKSMPLRVHIPAGDGIPGFEPRFTEFLKAAFHEWASASGGKINLRFVDQPADADIECLWTSDPSQLQNRAEGGEAQVYFQDGLIHKARIILLTMSMNRINPITDNSVKSVALHEVGHALGLFGHSPNPRDVMFFSAGIADNNPSLSARDRKTLLRLYSQN